MSYPIRNIEHLNPLLEILMNKIQVSYNDLQRTIRGVIKQNGQIRRSNLRL